jgi:hypothetical protein
MEDLDYAAILADMNRAFGKAPRWVHGRDKIRMPLWAFTTGDLLARIYWKQSVLLKRGQIVWGALVQANKNMFVPGPNNHPGNMIYSRDPDSFGRPDILLDAADSLFSIKGQAAATPELQRFADTLADEMERLLRVYVPCELTSGLETVFTGLMFDRRHLPMGIIDRRILPMLVHPDLDETMVLPCRYWPRAFLQVRV